MTINLIFLVLMLVFNFTEKEKQKTLKTHCGDFEDFGNFSLSPLYVMEILNISFATRYVYVAFKYYYVFKNELDVHHDLKEKTLSFT